MFVDQFQKFHRQLAIFYLRGGIKVTHGSTFHYRVFQHPSTLYSNFLTFPKLCVKCLVFASQLACHFWQWHHVNFAGSLRIRQYSWKFCNGTTIFFCLSIIRGHQVFWGLSIGAMSYFNVGLRRGQRLFWSTQIRGRAYLPVFTLKSPNPTYEAMVNI